MKNIFVKQGGCWLSIRAMLPVVFFVAMGRPSIGQTTVNYVRSWSVVAPDPSPNHILVRPLSDIRQVTAYYDGLGRPLQSVATQGSLETATGNNYDLVGVMGYDVMGRKNGDFLPYVATTADGSYKTDAATAQPGWYAGASNPFYGQGELGANAHSQTNFESSPLDRPLLSMGSGNSWVGSARGVQAGYLTNTIADSVVIWSVTNNGVGVFGSYALNGYYATGSLYKNASTDEAGHQVIEFKDNEGKTILKKVELSATDNGSGSGYSGWLSTYYIYDVLNNLRCVVQPAGVAVLAGTSWSFSATPVLLNEQCFRYEYDQRNRMVMKQVPGAGPVFMVYDAVDRLVMTQDANLLALNKWVVTVYDNLNRPIKTGLLTDATAFATELSNAAVSTSYPSTASNFELLTQTYYDNYTGWISGTGLSSSLITTYTGNSNYFITGYNASPVYAQPVVATSATQGLVTGTMRKVLGTTSQYLYSVSFYDSFDRVIQVESVNATGGVDTVTTQYDFSGHPLRVVEGIQKAGNTAQWHQVLTKLGYDVLNRPTTIFKNIDRAAADQLIETSQYDNLGQLHVKYLGNNLDGLVYDHNIRGWLTGINKNYILGTANHYFGMELGYDQTTSAATGTSYTTAQYNGNIAGTVWMSAGDGVDRKYDFTYDNVNRLTGAAYTDNKAGSWGTTLMDFSVSNLSYDGNGNIMTMNQNGFKVGASGGSIDMLSYQYQANSNKLSQVTDGANDPLSVLGDFHYKGTKGAYDYTYDVNGNLNADANKGLDHFVYNYLNLPQSMHMAGKGNIVYTYDAAGNKVQKQTLDSMAGVATTTIYLGGFQFQRRTPIVTPNTGVDTLQFLAHEDGRARWAFHTYLNGSTAYGWEYDFAEHDHLGNTRVLLTQEKDTAQYIATMEAAYRAKENALFYNLSTSCVARSSVPAPGYPADLTYTNPNDSVARVNGNGPQVGPAIILKVMSGDKFDIGVQYYYNAGTYTSAPPLSPQNLLNSLASGLATLSSVAGEGLSTLSNSTTSPLLAALTSSINNESGTGTSKPQAYLNWMLLDNQFNYVAGSSGAQQVGAAGQNGGNLQSPLAQLGLTMSKSGYLYIYVSNTTPGWDVFFDNLSVKQYSGPILEENHYYPFGLGMAGISDKAIKSNYAENKYRYNKGSELQNKEFSDGSGLEMYETHLRELDPQLGRWWQIDSKPDYSQSIYSAMGNNPFLHNDPMGDSVPKIAGQIPLPSPAAESTHPKSRIHFLGEKIGERAPAAFTLTVTKGAQAAIEVGKFGFDVNAGSKEVAKFDNYGPLPVDKEKTVTGGGAGIGIVKLSQENSTTSKTTQGTFGPVVTTTTEVQRSLSIGVASIDRTWTIEQTNQPNSIPEITQDTGPTLSGSNDRMLIKGGGPLGKTDLSLGVYYKVDLKINPVQILKNLWHDINTGGN